MPSRECRLHADNLQTAFDRVVVSEELGIPKPDPAPHQPLKEFDNSQGEAVA